MNLLRFKKPTRYIDSEINAVKKEAPVKVALAFADTYEIGMSHLGIKILYHIINSLDFALCERVFAPDRDMLEYLQQNSQPLRSLETGRALKEFDIVGFSLQYELSYPTVLKMLEVSGIALDRTERPAPVIIAGGPCTVNPSAMEDFIDAFLIGEAEEAIVHMLHLYRDCTTKEEFLKELSRLEGFYVPGYTKDRVKRRFILDLENAPLPVAPPVPYMQIVHDRINIELSRGCTRGCRFCQAGILYRPLRERSPEKVLHLVEESIKNTGYDEVSFTSLDVGDYTALLPLLREFNRRFGDSRISVSLPSIRVGAVKREILKEIKSVRKSGFTIAPEAATERLRSVINKDFRWEEYENALQALFSEGWLNLKLYFMIGLPGENEDDVRAIAEMAKTALRIAKNHTRRFVNITVSVSPFVPKPFTPFQWLGQQDIRYLSEMIQLLKSVIPRGINFKSHDLRMSMLEAALSRADSSAGRVLKKAVAKGAYLDAWAEYFDYSLWQKAMETTGVDLEEMARRQYDLNEELPWDIIDTGVSKRFLQRELQKALNLQTTSDCNTDICHACGLGCRSREFLSSKVSLQSHKKEQFSMDTYSFELIKSHRFKPVKIRIEYEKKEKMRYLSTLELMNTLLRAFRRAGVKIVYSEGYSPSPRISMGPALLVGVESFKEYLDIEVYPPFDILRMKDRINNTLPEGLSIKTMVFVHKKVPSLQSFITMYEYQINLSETDLKGLKLFNFSSKGPYSEFIVKFDIINQKTIRLRLQDLKQKKVKLRETIESLFGAPFEELRIIRTAQFGLYKGRWVDPIALVMSL